jgi:indolepyruvate ferredoxin oxidoreductase beta subunit
MDILIMGVGGQGALTAAKIIGIVAMSKGYDVKASEVHGMSKRGGSVETYVRYSKTPVAAPIIFKGGADIVLGFEALEALRGVVFLKKGGTMVMNTQRIDPMPVIIGAAEYPKNIEEEFKKLGINVLAINAEKIALEAGSLHAINVAMIGAISTLPEFEKDFAIDDWLDAIRISLPPKVVPMNEAAFEIGRKSAKAKVL